MKRAELIRTFNYNKVLCLATTATSGIGAFDTLILAVNHNPGAIIPALITTAGVTLAAWCGIDAIDASSRLATLRSTGLDAEPERPEAEARGPRGYRPSHEG